MIRTNTYTQLSMPHLLSVRLVMTGPFEKAFGLCEIVVRVVLG